MPYQHSSSSASTSALQASSSTQTNTTAQQGSTGTRTPPQGHGTQGHGQFSQTKEDRMKHDLLGIGSQFDSNK